MRDFPEILHRMARCHLHHDGYTGEDKRLKKAKGAVMELALLLSLVLVATIIGWLGFYLEDRELYTLFPTPLVIVSRKPRSTRLSPTREAAEKAGRPSRYSPAIAPAMPA